MIAWKHLFPLLHHVPSLHLHFHSQHPNLSEDPAKSYANSPHSRCNAQRRRQRSSYEQIIPPRPSPKRSDTSFSSFKRREKGESTMIVPPPPAPEEEEDLDDHAFDHPSTYVEQPWIWVPKDKLGLSKVIIKELQDAGVSASDEGATMDRKGVVEVTRNPPDEEWAGGHTH
ncbi:phosphate metabolism protein 7 [Stygiomarasmius scandens]|uniref:Phosphate metabolism protein 7 n=1 Tax=Marasmiellus scandens TaxID=2682957 RepID=A0ABR1IY46_9AGAR